MNERLARDHVELGDLLDEVIAALDERDVALSHAALDLFWARLAVHIRAEHLHLLPAILDRPSEGRENVPSASQVLSTVEELRCDHNFFMRELSQAVAMTRGWLTSADPQLVEQQFKGVRSRIDVVRDRLDKHDRLEEEGIYLWTSSLSQADQTTLAAGVQRELENMPPRFGAGSTSKP